MRFITEFEITKADNYGGTNLNIILKTDLKTI